MQNIGRSVFYCCLASHSLYKFVHHWFNYVIQSKERNAASSMKIVPIRKFLIVKVEIASESAVSIFLSIGIGIRIADSNSDPESSIPVRRTHQVMTQADSCVCRLTTCTLFYCHIGPFLILL